MENQYTGMIDITHKSSTLRKAIATATVKVGREETILAVLERRVPKGDVFEMAKTAGLFAAKRTHDMIPDCHPLPVEFTAVRYSTGLKEIGIEVEVHTVYKTGVEVEAMHAASVVALTIYDMLKPIDKEISIENIRLLEKTGGKTQYAAAAGAEVPTRVVVCSDTLAAGKGEDRSGLLVAEKLQHWGIDAGVPQIIPDDAVTIASCCRDAQAAGTRLLVFTGGTGLSPRDITPEALFPLLDRRIPGIEEAMRQYGQQRTPYAMLSRSVAGMIGDMMVLALPGSSRGAAESLDAIFPALLHIFRVRSGMRHDGG
jgi:molybdenum cofactor biosynthesis protein MoaC